MRACLRDETQRGLLIYTQRVRCLWMPAYCVLDGVHARQLPLIFVLSILLCTFWLAKRILLA
jgi:hypothetical protein